LSGAERSANNGVAEGAAEALEDGRAQQKRLDALGLPLQNLFMQVIQHEMVAAGE
jgi:hypothetical protein